MSDAASSSTRASSSTTVSQRIDGRLGGLGHGVGHASPQCARLARALIVDYPGDGARFRFHAVRGPRGTRSADEHAREAALELLGRAAQDRRRCRAARRSRRACRGSAGPPARACGRRPRAVAGVSAGSARSPAATVRIASNSSLRLAALVDDPVDAGDQAGDDERRVGVRAVEHDLRGRDARLDRTRHLEPVAVRKVVVEHDHVRARPVDQVLDLGRAGGAADVGHVGLVVEHHGQARPDGGVVIDDGDTDHGIHGRWARRLSRCGSLPFDRCGCPPGGMKRRLGGAVRRDPPASRAALERSKPRVCSS